MKRFMGMMPSDEIEKSCTYRDNANHTIHIDAGPNGWTVIYPDQSTHFKDCVASTEENFQEALARARQDYPDIKESAPVTECAGEM